VARVAGLSPVERLVAVEWIARTIAQLCPQPPAPDLSPRAAPVSIYSAARKTTPRRRLRPRQLAAALGQLNPALNNFAGTFSTSPAVAAGSGGQNKIGGMTFDEAQKGVKTAASASFRTRGSKPRS
jgi:hypothetical protein